MPPAWLARNATGRPCSMRISSALSSPDSAAAAKPVADLDALDRVDAHQRRGEVGVELAVDRRARARAARRSATTSITAPQEEPALRTSSRYSSHARPPPASGQKNGLSSTSSQSQRARSMRVRPDLHQRAADRDAGAQHLARDRAGGDPHRRLARRGAAAAAVVADAVFQLSRCSRHGRGGTVSAISP